MSAPAIDGVGHIDLTVRDAESSAQWWEQVLGFKVVNVDERAGRTGYGMFHPCGLSVILVQHPQPTTVQKHVRDSSSASSGSPCSASSPW